MTEHREGSRERNLHLPVLRTPAYRQVTLQLVRFGLSGAFVFGIYTGGTLLLSGPLGLPIVLAIAIAFPVALAINFTMQRHFVFLDHETFALGARTQFARYTFAAVVQLRLTHEPDRRHRSARAGGVASSSCSWSPRW